MRHGIQCRGAGRCAAIQKNEQVLWHKAYLDTAKELGQWEVVTEYARAADDCQLQVEALWRIPDWEGLRLDVLPRAMVGAIPPGQPTSSECVLHQTSSRPRSAAVTGKSGVVESN